MKLVCIVAASLLVASHVVADSAVIRCSPGDIGGSWVAYQSAGMLGYQKCGLVIRADGRVLSGTTCENADGVQSQVTGGQVRVETQCRVRGSISNTLGRFTIQHAWMAPNKDTVSGVGKDSAQTPISVQIVRRPYDWIPDFLRGQL